MYRGDVATCDNRTHTSPVVTAANICTKLSQSLNGKECVTISHSTMPYELDIICQVRAFLFS